MDDPLVSSEAKDHTSERYRHSQMAEETRSVEKNYEFDRALWNITATFSREERDNDKMWNSSFKNTVEQYAANDCSRWKLLGFRDGTRASGHWALGIVTCIVGGQITSLVDKTIAFVGDSLGRQQFQSLMCMVTSGEERPEIENVGWKYGLTKTLGAVRPDGWAYWFPHTNTTILYYWSATLCDLEPININDTFFTDFAMHLDRPPAFLKQYLHQFDVLILNTGHHWSRPKFRANRWVLHLNGKPIEGRHLVALRKVKKFAIYSIVRWVDSQMTWRPRLKTFFRTISPRHFFGGDWDTSGRCDNTIPLAGGNEVKQDESSDSIVGNAVKGTKVKILDITAISQLRDEGHISRYGLTASDGAQDCLHWCLPGIPDTWNELLCAQV
ncbi:hypothetical protein RHSIM_Rhsim10G0132400 [Rhododendron simsii]|uniref:Trichome birefringence-like C-terminal domain-containing protein n=1 Tax=Rhododendron simsii TaxID=118357 RepID=A0A834G9E0_RHOSS|nr:hypothetical protein RHSIM_Rhsim10G0132400 [Rhododendron simsii]